MTTEPIQLKGTIMSENTIDLTNDDAARLFVNAVKNGERKAQAYVETHGVTVENLPEHVAALTALAYPNVKPSSRADRNTREYAAHNFRNAVRNAMKRCLGTEDTEASDTDYLAKFIKATEAALGHNVTPQALVDALHAAMSDK